MNLINILSLFCYYITFGNHWLIKIKNNNSPLQCLPLQGNTV